MKRIVSAIVVLLVLVASPAFTAEAKIGYVDLQKALNQSEAGKAAKEKIAEEVKEYEGVIESRQEELKNLKAGLEKKSMLLSEEARTEKERNYQQKLKDFQRFTKDIQEKLQQKDADYTRKILEEMFKVIEKFGKQKGYTMILEKTESSVLYADEAVDLTDELIEAYNASHSEEGS